MRAEERKLVAQARRRRIWMRVVGALACVVVFCTTYALILPAIALEHEKTAYCGLEEHEHGEECYEVKLVCGYGEEADGTAGGGTEAATTEESGQEKEASAGENSGEQQEGEYYALETVSTAGETEGHVHTDACYETKKVLTCKQEAGEGHTHSDSCYEEKLTCGQEESEGHTHSDACYEEKEVLTCSQEEGEDHTHTGECYTTEKTLTCGQEESEGHSHTQDCYTKDLTCGQEEGGSHEHTDACYEEKRELICGEEEGGSSEETEDTDETETSGTEEEDKTAGEHVHTEDCYEEVLVCEQEEHTHTLKCYSNPDADVESAEDWEATLPEELSGIWAEDLVAVAKSQLGYTESVDNYDVIGEEKTNKEENDAESEEESTEDTADEEENLIMKGYTRYGEWYGDPYGDWNAMFVSFCLNYAGIPADVIPQEADVQDWIEALAELEESNRSAAEEVLDEADEDAETEDGAEESEAEVFDLSIKKEGYEPQAGDLVLIDSDEDGEADRIGIVAEYKKAGLLSEAKVKTIEGDSNDKVEYVTYEAEAEAIWGYVSMPESDAITIRTYEGEDYIVTARYGADAKIPEEAELIATEYEKDSETYLARYEEAAELYGWEKENDMTETFRLFNIGFFVDDEEIEPAARVSITVTYLNQEESKNYQVTHFGAKETENVEVENSYEDGEQNIGFEANGFSDYGISLMAYDLNNLLDGTAFAIVNGSRNVAMLAGRSSNTTTNTRAGQGVRLGTNASGETVAQVYTDAVKDAIEIWHIESVTANRNTYYYIYTIVNNQQQYLVINGSDVTLSANRDDNNTNNTQRITFTRGTGTYAGMYRLTNSAGVAINLYGGSADQGFGGYNDSGDNEWHYLCPAEVVDLPGTVEGMTPNGTVINVFDYWATYNGPQVDGDGNLKGDYNETTSENVNVGINENHSLKFTRFGASNIPSINTSRSELTTGIVQNKLESKYPYLAVNTGVTRESLNYLFDPSISHNGKASYPNAGGLLQVSDDGYYVYDSQENYAELDTETNQFTLYETWGVNGVSANGQFFPFDKFEDAVTQGSTTDYLNHYFGMTLTARFIQQYGGHTDSSRRSDMIFEFSGDDDVWIFVDDVLVADLGGIRGRYGVSINFSTGEVAVKNNGEEIVDTRTLAQAFNTAGVSTSGDGWTTSGGNTIFADNTYHTLKFFYLERGNSDSNLRLKYNLKEIPSTGIYKVNQYGDAVAGAGFAVYRAEKGTDGEGNVKYTIIDEEPAYKGTTNAKGEMIFVNSDGMPMSMDEILGAFGSHFVLKETSVPEGYRLVSDEIYLYIQNGVLFCDNTYDSGVWASSNIRVTATASLPLANGTYEGSDTVTYYDAESTTAKGTLFAVVLKYVGSGDPTNDTNNSSWAAVYGNDMDGYNTISTGNTMQDIINAAKEQLKLNNNGDEKAVDNGVVFTLSPSGAMEVGLENLPGDIGKYYYMLDGNSKSQTEYTVAYYWCSEDSLSKATTGNTYRVNADPATNYDGFTRAFGATIEVPNLMNRLIVQKLDEDGNLVNGAAFALYEVEEEDGIVYYLNDNGNKVALSANAVINPNTGVITEGPAVIQPVNVATTVSAAINGLGEDGTTSFTNLTEGYYYLREISAPEGYSINSTEIRVRVANDAIYANAGTSEDGVTVARGPGYVVSTLEQFASKGEIDNTLTWIYALLRANTTNNSFAAVPNNFFAEDDTTNWPYLADQSGTPASSMDAAMRTYLTYDTSETSTTTLFNYRPSSDTVINGSDAAGVTGTILKSRRLYTDVGWAYYELYQNGAYGSSNHAEGATYTDLEGGDISNLFSLSTYVQVTDNKAASLEIIKTVVNESGSALTEEQMEQEFTFTVNLYQETAAEEENGEPVQTPLTGTYAYTIYGIAATEGGTDTVDRTGTITFGGTEAATITLKHNQYAVIQGLPHDAYYTVTETFMSEYVTTVSKNGDTSSESNIATGRLRWGTTTAECITTVAYTNTFVQTTDLVIRKVSGENTATALNGAEFTFTYTKDEITYYYNSDGTWTETEATLTTQGTENTGEASGKIELKSIRNGEYTLTETKAPDGYKLLTNPITITVADGVIRTAVGGTTSYELSTDRLTVTVPNSAGITLPNTGGAGTKPYTYGGLLLIATAMMCEYILRRKGKRRCEG